MMQSYKELKVYQKSYALALRIYEISKTFPKEEQYGLTSQIKRASTSVPLNIAEGYGKSEQGKEVVRFLSMSRGSNAELEVLLSFAKDFSYISEAEYEKLKEQSEEVGRMLTGLIKSIKEKFTNS